VEEVLDTLVLRDWKSLLVHETCLITTMGEVSQISLLDLLHVCVCVCVCAMFECIYMYVYHIHAWCPQRSVEGTGAPRTGLKGQSPGGCWKSSLSPLEASAVSHCTISPAPTNFFYISKPSPTKEILEKRPWQINANEEKSTPKKFFMI